MRRILALGFVMLLSTPAFAAESDDASSSSAEIKPRQIDAKANIRTSPLLQYGGVGASGDVGIARLGPGTFAAGGSISYEACASTCWGTPLDFSQRSFWIEGRASYHLQAPRIGYLDVYPLFTLGMAISGARIHVVDSEYRASSVAPAVGFGGGASYFFSKMFFVSAEAQLRYSGGAYDYELARGPARPFDSRGVDSWNATTIALSIGAGARF